MILGLCSKKLLFFLRNKVAWLDPDRQQLDWASRGILKPIQWVMKPKVHSFDHQLQLILRTRLNSRHTHCFVDEDGMKHLKSLALRHPSVNLEAFILRASRLRMKLSAKKMASLRRSSARRSSRWKKTLCVKACARIVCSNCICLLYLHFRAFVERTLFWRPFLNGPDLGGLWRFRVYIYIYVNEDLPWLCCLFHHERVYSSKTFWIHVGNVYFAVNSWIKKPKLTLLN